jgi:ABC-type Fe3+-siderophore transport system permease subunit
MSQPRPNSAAATGADSPDPAPPPVPGWLGPSVLLAALIMVAIVLSRTPFVSAVLALDAPFAPIPDPLDDELAEPTFGNAVRASTPLLIGAYLLVSGFICDALARRQFDYSGALEARRPAGYVAVAVLLVFPQVLLAAPALAWGLYNLASWARFNDAALPAGVLLGLLVAIAAAALALARNRGVWPRVYIAG